MRLLHFSDLHLDTTFPWASPEAGRVRRGELLATLEALVALAREVDAQFILSAGDLYDAERAGPETAEALRAAFERAAPRHVILLPGTSDPAGRTGLYASTEWSPNVRVVTNRIPEPIELKEGVRLWVGTDFSGFTPQGDGAHLALCHGDAPDGFVHVMGGGRHLPDPEGFTYPGCPAAVDLGGGDGSAILVTIGADGSVDCRRRQVGRGAPPERVPDLAPWLEGKAEDHYDLAILSEEQTVRGEFVRDVLSAELADGVGPRALLAGLRALDEDLPELAG